MVFLFAGWQVAVGQHKSRHSSADTSLPCQPLIVGCELVNADASIPVCVSFPDGITQELACMRSQCSQVASATSKHTSCMSTGPDAGAALLVHSPDCAASVCSWQEDYGRRGLGLT